MTGTDCALVALADQRICSHEIEEIIHGMKKNIWVKEIEIDWLQPQEAELRRRDRIFAHILVDVSVILFVGVSA